MGDRANFGFRANADAPIINLYAHWGGDGMMSNLAYALNTARPRWRDHGYATRICISQLVREDWGQGTGYGIYVDTLGDNEHSVPVVNWADQTVSLYPYGFYRYEDAGEPKFVMGFEEFINKFSKFLTTV
jgi:hypothetical protein